MTVYRAAKLTAAIIAGAGALAACGGSGGGGSVTQPTPTWQLQGTVSETQSGKRLAGARVEVMDGRDAGRYDISDASGAYRIAGLTPGGFSVKATASGHTSVSQGVTLTSNQAADFSLALASPLLTATIDPATISPKPSGDPQFPNELAFTLVLVESNNVDVTVEATYFRLLPATGEPVYWEEDKAWLTEWYSPLTFGGGTKLLRKRLIYDDEVYAGALAATIDLVDSLGRTYRVFANANVAPASTAGMAGPVEFPMLSPPPRAPRR